MRPLYLPLSALFFCTGVMLPNGAAAQGIPSYNWPEIADTTCTTGTIRDLQINTRAVFDTTYQGRPPALRLLYRIGNALHSRTRESVIRRELLLREGDCFDPFLITETERILRDNQYIASARIHQREREDGDHELIVETQDEWSARLDLRASFNNGIELEGVHFRESNFLGRGQALELFYLDYNANRDYGISFHTHQFGGHRWHLGVGVGRTRTGPLYNQSLSYPFREETGRWAFREEFRETNHLFDYRIDDGESERHLLLPTRTSDFGIAAIHRLGRPGNQFTLGLALGYTDISFPGGLDATELIEDDDYDDPLEPDAALLEAIRRQAVPLRSLRSTILLGHRRIHWTRGQGFDTMRGEQDIRYGTEIGIALGRSLTTTHTPHHIFTALDIYAGTGSEDLLLIGRLRGDAQHFLGAGRDDGWNDLFTQAELLAYWKTKTSLQQTLVFRASTTTGRKTRSPFQLTLGGELGVRGYAEERFPGGRRLLLSLEDRITFNGPFQDFMDLGATAFIDLGRIWPGDAPFGIDSGWRAAAGIGIRNAFPSGGRRTYRIDLAFPLQQHLGWRDLRLILSIGEMIGVTPTNRRTRIEERQRFTSRNPFYFPD